MPGTAQQVFEGGGGAFLAPLLSNFSRLLNTHPWMHVLLHSSGPFPKKIETSSHMYFKNSQSLYRVNLLSDQFVQNAKNKKILISFLAIV